MHQVVAMDHFVAPAKAEQCFDVRAAFADDARGVAIAVGDHAARDLVAVAIEHAHGVAARKAAAHRRRRRRAAGSCPSAAPAGRQRRWSRHRWGAANRRSTACAHSRDSTTAGTSCTRRPLPGGARDASARPAAMAMAQPAAVAIFAAAILVAMPPEPTADAEPPPMASISGRDVADFGNQPRRRIEVRIGGVQPGDIRQQQQAIRAGHLRDTRRQAIVVAVADFGGRHRVVFVDDRQCTELEQLRQAWRGRSDSGAGVRCLPALTGSGPR